MSEEDRQEAFLDRWSRLKRESPARPAERPAAAAASPPPAPPLPPVEKLTPESDFTPFMGARVDPEMRRSALKKLFADAHFNAVDPFEPYSVDLTVAESIPEEMLKNLEHAKRLLFDEPEKAAGAPAEAQPSAQAPAGRPGTDANPSDVAGRQDA